MVMGHNNTNTSTRLRMLRNEFGEKDPMPKSCMGWFHQQSYFCRKSSPKERESLMSQQSVPGLRKGIQSDSKEDIESPKPQANISKDGKALDENKSPSVGISSTGLKVLALLALQNSCKNILMRFVMKDQPSFLLSTAVITIESLKLLMASLYIVLVERQSLQTIVSFLKDHKRNTLLLCIPASAYSLQMSLEYIAFANIDAASFSVLVQIKMLTTAFFFRVVLKRQLRKKQVLSLVLLTVGVMLCNMKDPTQEVEQQAGNTVKGILATLGEEPFFIELYL